MVILYTLLTISWCARSTTYKPYESSSYNLKNIYLAPYICTWYTYWLISFDHLGLIPQDICCYLIVVKEKIFHLINCGSSVVFQECFWPWQCLLGFFRDLASYSLRLIIYICSLSLSTFHFILHSQPRILLFIHNSNFNHSPPHIFFTIHYLKFHPICSSEQTKWDGWSTS